jgi:hypothetical protein
LLGNVIYWIIKQEKDKKAKTKLMKSKLSKNHLKSLKLAILAIRESNLASKMAMSSRTESNLL